MPYSSGSPQVSSHVQCFKFWTITTYMCCIFSSPLLWYILKWRFLQIMRICFILILYCFVAVLFVLLWIKAILSFPALGWFRPWLTATAALSRSLWTPRAYELASLFRRRLRKLWVCESLVWFESGRSVPQFPKSPMTKMKYVRRTSNTGDAWSRNTPLEVKGHSVKDDSKVNKPYTSPKTPLSLVIIRASRFYQPTPTISIGHRFKITVHLMVTALIFTQIYVYWLQKIWWQIIVI